MTLVDGVAAISVEGLRVVRGGRLVLRDLTCATAKGRVTGLLGPSGCGKSTLMRSVVGVQRITAGRVEVLGEPAGARGLRARVGYVTQAPAVYLDLTVRENLRYFARVVDAAPSRIDDAIATVGLERHAGDAVGRLSGGERARVSLATALVGTPQVLVLDEPTVGLDPVLRRDLWTTFHELAATGVTVLVSSHVMDEADRCDDLLLMRDGLLLEAESPASLRRRTGADSLDEAFLRTIEGPGGTA